MDRVVIGEILGVKTGEKFSIPGGYCNPYYIDANGHLIDSEGDHVFNLLTDLINGKIQVESIPKWTEIDITIARGRVAEGTPWVARNSDGKLFAYKTEPSLDWDGAWSDAAGDLDWDMYLLDANLLLQINPGKCVDLREIIKMHEIAIGI